jgi:hypothetical protein
MAFDPAWNVALYVERGYFSAEQTAALGSLGP